MVRLQCLHVLVRCFGLSPVMALPLVWCTSVACVVQPGVWMVHVWLSLLSMCWRSLRHCGVEPLAQLLLMFCSPCIGGGGLTYPRRLGPSVA